eukprot:g6897.t1
MASRGPGPLVKEGWLYKKGVSRRNWKKRWFCLLGTELRYYASRPVAVGKQQAPDYDNACKGSVQLRGRPHARPCTLAKVVQKYKNAFEIPAPDLRHVGHSLDAIEYEEAAAARNSLSSRGSMDALGAIEVLQAARPTDGGGGDGSSGRGSPAAYLQRAARVYLLYAESGEEKAAWIHALRDVVLRSRAAIANGVSATDALETLGPPNGAMMAIKSARSHSSGTEAASWRESQESVGSATAAGTRSPAPSSASLSSTPAASAASSLTGRATASSAARSPGASSADAHAHTPAAAPAPAHTPAAGGGAGNADAPPGVIVPARGRVVRVPVRADAPAAALHEAQSAHARLMQLLQSGADAAALAAAPAAGIAPGAAARARSASDANNAFAEESKANVCAWHVALRTAWQLRPLILFDSVVGMVTPASTHAAAAAASVASVQAPMAAGGEVAGANANVAALAAAVPAPPRGAARSWSPLPSRAAKHLPPQADGSGSSGNAGPGSDAGSSARVGAHGGEGASAAHKWGWWDAMDPAVIIAEGGWARSDALPGTAIAAELAQTEEAGRRNNDKSGALARSQTWTTRHG